MFVDLFIYLLYFFINYLIVFSTFFFFVTVVIVSVVVVTVVQQLKCFFMLSCLFIIEYYIINKPIYINFFLCSLNRMKHVFLILIWSKVWNIFFLFVVCSRNIHKLSRLFSGHNVKHWIFFLYNDTVFNWYINI